MVMRITIPELQRKARSGDKITMITAYDYAMARIADKSGVEAILVGDSLANTVLGYESTVPVTMDEMLHHTRPVVRGTQNVLVVADMPFMSYQVSPETAHHNAGRFLQEGGAQAVKLEGGALLAKTVWKIVQNGIPVMGHIGLTPQSINTLGGYRVQGKSPQKAAELLQDAIELERAGAFAIVLECIPAPLARLITEKVNIPTIGIGAGPDCDGQVQVIHDLLGFFEGFSPKHAKKYATVSETILAALKQYVSDVSEGLFPSSENSFDMDEGLLDALYGARVEKP
jgi:3-methyl-2-oxobutanoate hydroxymethyltransferase